MPLSGSERHRSMRSAWRRRISSVPSVEAPSTTISSSAGVLYRKMLCSARSRTAAALKVTMPTLRRAADAALGRESDWSDGMAGWRSCRTVMSLVRRAGGTQQGLVGLEGGLPASVPGEQADPLSAGRDQLGATRIVEAEPEQCVLDRGDVVGIEQLGGRADHLRDRAGIRARHRATTGHGFERRDAEAFVLGGVHEDVRMPVGVRQVFVGAAQATHRAGPHAERVDQRCLVALNREAAEEQEVEFVAQARGPCVRSQRRLEILVAAAVADVEQVGAWWRAGRAGGLAREDVREAQISDADLVPGDI